MKILIACEFSGAVRDAFRAMGHDAYSCDLRPSPDSSPHHYQMDALEALRGHSWDFVGMHPPCTRLSVSSIHWNNRGRGWEGTEAAMEFVNALVSACGHTPFYLENPVSIISTRWRKPNQIIQPYEFGEDASKKTCFWLQHVSPLTIDPEVRLPGRWVEHNGKMVERWSNQTDSGQNRLGPSEDREKVRSLTYPKIAEAMANQWGGGR